VTNVWLSWQSTKAPGNQGATFTIQGQPPEPSQVITKSKATRNISKQFMIV
jgi:hypothetical protein